MRKADRIMSLVIFIVGICIVAESLTFDFFDHGSPGPGFLPFWVGLCLALLAGAQLIGSFRKAAAESDEPNPFTREGFKPFVVFLGGSTLLVLVTPITGLMIPLGLLTGFSAWYFGTKNKRTIILLTVLTPLITYGLFDAFLGVPLPKGILGI